MEMQKTVQESAFLRFFLNIDKFSNFSYGSSKEARSTWIDKPL